MSDYFLVVFVFILPLLVAHPPPGYGDRQRSVFEFDWFGQLYGYDIMVYTAGIGNQTLTAYANSTLPGREDINDLVRVNVRTLFPVEFPGLSWPAVIVLLFLAGLAYLRFGAARE